MFWQKAFILITFCLSVLVQGQVTESFDFKCITEYPTTSFIFTDDKDYFKVRILHHNGTKFAPFIQRLVVPNDMSMVLEAAEVAKTTGRDIELRFAKSGCKHLNSEIFSCVGEGESLTSTKKQIKPWHISRTLVTSQTPNGEFKKYTLTMSYDVDGKSYDYVMDYLLNECEVNK